jgi:hypothetical protein
MVTPNLYASRGFAATAVLAVVTACAAKPIPAAVVPARVANTEAEPLLEQAAAAFGNQHPHKLEPRFVWARGSGFDMVRHQISGAIIARGVGMGMYVFDTSNSQCWIWICDMYQEEVGGRWSEPVIPIETCIPPAQVTCESLDRVIAQAQASTESPPPAP